MIKKAIVVSIFFTIGASMICFGKAENSATKVDTIEKGVTLYELEETGQQFFVCGKGKTVVFVPDDCEGIALPSERPIDEPTGDPTEDPTEDEPTEDPTDAPIRVY